MGGGHGGLVASMSALQLWVQGLNLFGVCPAGAVGCFLRLEKRPVRFMEHKVGVNVGV